MTTEQQALNEDTKRSPHQMYWQRRALEAEARVKELTEFINGVAEDFDAWVSPGIKKRAQWVLKK